MDIRKDLLQNNKCHLCEFAYRLEEHDLSVISEVEVKDEIIYTAAVGVARNKGTVWNEFFIASLEVFRDHYRRSKALRGQVCPKVKSKPQATTKKVRKGSGKAQKL